MLADILSALSCALDMVEGQPVGHAVRTCLIAMRIGQNLGLSTEELADLYYAALMKDAGCSSNSVRIQKIFGGDELLAKRDVKIIDWSSLAASASFAIKHVEPGASPSAKFKKLLAMMGDPESCMASLTRARCSRGAQIALQLGFGERASEAIRCLDEHWDGKGAPGELKGEGIPILARVLCLAQTLEVLAKTFGVSEAFGIVRKRNKRWFDPAVTEAALPLETDQVFWKLLESEFRDMALKLATPAALRQATDSTVDQICDAFASIIDAKSAFTGEHSTRVTAYSVGLADAMGFDADRVTTIRRAALLHDIGKLGVSTSILDKPGRLTDEEFAAVKLHPLFTQRILSMIKGFERITEVASAHHERLDGRGYHMGYSAPQLDMEMRIVAAADVFDALSANRPYRDALSMKEVFAIMEVEAGTALDPDCVGLLKDCYLNGARRLAA